MQVVLMRNERDCQISSLGSATGKTYEQVSQAFKPLPAQDPIDSNPESLYYALIRLGFWKRNITWTMLEQRKALPEKTVILVHNAASPYLVQHWIVLAKYDDNGIWAYWGDRVEPRLKSWAEMKHLFLDGFPNSCFQVINDTAWERFKRWIGI